MEKLAFDSQINVFVMDHFNNQDNNHLSEAEGEPSVKQWPKDTFDGLNQDQLEKSFSDPQNYKQEELNALDLRIFKELQSSEFSVVRQNKTHVKSIAQLLENFYYNDSCCENNYPRVAQSGFYNPNKSEEDYSELVIDYSTSSFSDKTDTAIINNRLKDAATNTDMNDLIDQETQTEKISANDATSQTDLEPNNAVCEAENNSTVGCIVLTCSLCQKSYTNKDSYDLHLKTHLKTAGHQANKKAIMNVKFLTQAKLQFYNRRLLKCISKKENNKKTTMVQMPRCSSKTMKSDCFQLELPFTSEHHLDDQKKNDCFCEPFPMVECKKCSLKFYTVACLEEHVVIAHNKSLTSDCYYCVFCNDKFDDADKFHAHLDKHVHYSPLN